MIVWINGAFGAGKTQTAFELHRRILGSFVYDPENVGYFIWKNSPKSLRNGDFQNLPMWREMNYSMLKHIAQGYDGTIIVPMTLCNKDYYDEIVSRLLSDGIDVRHYVLMAAKETILRRLLSRGDGANSWAAQQIDRCLSGFADGNFETKIDTDGMSIKEVVESIASLSGINLLPDNRSSIRRFMDRISTQIRHIRL